MIYDCLLRSFFLFFCLQTCVLFEDWRMFDLQRRYYDPVNPGSLPLILGKVAKQPVVCLVK